MTGAEDDRPTIQEPVVDCAIGLVREVTELPDGRRITFYSRGDSDG